MISKETISAVLDRADIVEVVRESGVELRKAGREWVACCPFHGEKTPSFHVSPVRQTWHCFGGCQTGGNAIDYVMRREGLTFPEAVKRLAERYGIELAEERESAEEHTRRLRLEALQGVSERAAAWFAAQLHAPCGAKALRYAEERWGATYVGEARLGYAPESFHALYDWAVETGEKLELLIELGLLRRKEETGRIYDGFRGRLMIPVRNRAGRCVAFTARDLTGADDVPKYLNSPESELYHKGSLPFGLDTGCHEAMRSEKWYLVEGASDAMKLQSVGVACVAAPLGGTWTADQLKELGRCAPGVCFIPDADAVPQGQRYGAGIGYVLKNGEQALRLGLTVSVKEIPTAEGNLKQDPGSFITSRAMLERIPEEDFITWAAGKLFSKDDAPSVQTDVVRRVAEMLSYVTDDVRLEYLLPSVTKVTRGKREMYLNLVRKLRWERESGEQRKRGEVDLRAYGFYEEKRPGQQGYWAQTEKGGDVQWSNFTIRPLFHIKDEERPRRLFYLKGEDGREDIVEMTMEDLNSPAKFRQKIEGVGNYLWMGNDRDMIKLKRYLYDRTETASVITQLGWNGRGQFYAWGNGVYGGGRFHGADEFGIVRYGDRNWYIPAASKLYRDDPLAFERERKMVHLNLQNVTAAEYLQRFAEVYGTNGKVGLMYWVASLFRDIVVAHTDKFPLLNLFGPKGSGKSQMAAALMAFFVTDYKAPNIQSATPAALSYEVAATSDALVHIDEYKNDIDARRIDFLKGLYDGAGRMKMGGSAYDKIEMTAVKTGVILSGQELPTADIALFHRCIFLSFPKSTFTSAEKERFDSLRRVQRLGLTSVTLSVLDLRQRFEATFRDTYGAVTADLTARLGEAAVETRLLENWAKILAAFRCVEDRLRWPMTYGEMLEASAELLRRQNKMSGEGNELGKFWETVQYLHDTGDLYEEGDYQLRRVTELKTDLTSRTMAEPVQVVYLNTSRVFTLYKQALLRSGSKPLPEDALREYLKNATYYLGRKTARFKVIIDGYEQKAQPGQPGSGVKQAPRRALVFDYEAITMAYGISLETDDGSPTAEEQGPDDMPF